MTLNTTNNQWVIKVAYKDGFESRWKDGTIAGVVIAAFCLSMLVLNIMIAQTQYQELLFKMMPASYLYYIYIYYLIFYSRRSIKSFFSR